jgi:hypothetical protein
METQASPQMVFLMYKNLKYMYSGFCVVPVVWSAEFMTFLWFLICKFVQALFLSLIVNFQFFNCHFPVTKFRQDLF